MSARHDREWAVVEVWIHIRCCIRCMGRSSLEVAASLLEVAADCDGSRIRLDDEVIAG